MAQEKNLKNWKPYDAQHSHFQSRWVYTLADILMTALCVRLHTLTGLKYFSDRLLSYWAQVQRRPSFAAAEVLTDYSQTSVATDYLAFVKTNGIG